MTRNYKNIIIPQNQYNLIAEGISNHFHHTKPLLTGEYVALYGDDDQKIESPIHVIITDNTQGNEEYRFQRIAEEKKPDTTLADALNGLAKAFFANKLMDMRWRMAMAGVSNFENCK